MSFSCSTSVLLPAVKVSSIPQPTVSQPQVAVPQPQSVATTVTATLGGFLSSPPTISAPDPVTGY